jgi:hypothetical protein
MDNTPAFPSLHWVAPQGHSANENPQGMTLRDYFAAKAMMGLLTAEIVGEYSNEHVANISYLIADAMMKERSE